jgi:hypothetical protein
MPSKGYSRPPQVTDSGLVVRHTTEDGSITTVFDFREVDCPPELLLSLANGFAVACGPDGRWRASISAKNGSAAMRAFIKSVAEQPNPPARIGDISPEVWWAWRAEMAKTNRWPSVIQLVQGLLTDTSGVPESTRRALRARLSKPKKRLYNAYSRSEFQRIRSTAAGIVRTALHRIDVNTALLEAYRAGGEAQDTPSQTVGGQRWTAGSLLDCLARTGTLPKQHFTSRRGPLRELINLDGAKTIVEALFPNSVEILAVCVLLVCERGYNCSVLENLTIADLDRADDHAEDEQIHVLHLDKPRRGAGSRYSDESLTGEASRTIARTIALTAQARETVRLIGRPTDSLFMFRKSNTGGQEKSLFETRVPRAGHFIQCWQDRTKLTADDGGPLWLSLQRLRLTEQVLNNKPRQNSPNVSESVYRQPDPQTRSEAKGVIVRGQLEAIDHARVTVAMRTVSDQEIEGARSDPAALAQRLGVPPEKVRLLLSGVLNTATGACLDFNASPFAVEPDDGCPASFLACLGCPNAVATPAHLPRLVALGRALERIGSAVTREVWLEDYADHYGRLTDLLESNTTPQQREHLVQEVRTEDEAVIDRLLTRGFDE